MTDLRKLYVIITTISIENQFEKLLYGNGRLRE